MRIRHCALGILLPGESNICGDGGSGVFALRRCLDSGFSPGSGAGVLAGKTFRLADRAFLARSLAAGASLPNFPVAERVAARHAGQRPDWISHAAVRKALSGLLRANSWL